MAEPEEGLVEGPELGGILRSSNRSGSGRGYQDHQEDGAAIQLNDNYNTKYRIILYRSVQLIHITSVLNELIRKTFRKIIKFRLTIHFC